ncbi:MAG TPA: helix-turn-helix domain-containing protein [Sandaracinaceae bacterium]
MSREWVRAMRGPRSQTALSRRLGYRTNVIYRWESGARSPTASEALLLAQRVGVDPVEAMKAFSRSYGVSDFATGIEPEPLAAWLRALCTSRPQKEIAERSGISRSRVSRILAARTRVTWCDFLRLVEAATRRVLAFLGGFVDPAKLPSAARAWARDEAFRRLAIEHPMSEALLALLRLESYRALPAHDDAWLAARLRIPEDEVRAALRALSRAGLVRRVRGRYRLARPWSVEMETVHGPRVRSAPMWMRRIADLDLPSTRGHYVVFDCTRSELARMTDILTKAYHECREILSASRGSEVAGVFVQAIVDISSLPEAGALGGATR